MSASFTAALQRRTDRTGPRHAALLLHALDERDRQWLMASLTPPERAAVDPLLAELRDLGVRPGDAGTWVGGLVSGAAEPAAEAPPHRTSGTAFVLEALAGVLRTEPPSLVAAACRMQDATLRSALADRIPLSTPARFGSASSEGLPPRLADSLARHLQARVEAHAGARPDAPAVQRSLRQRLLALWLRVLRAAGAPGGRR